jgi:pSer/pThr/pTyr-binding forkhead associated (FHA) protein
MILDDISIDALHAQLQREGDTYRIMDMGSTAGTWVNYSPVSREGILLEHGDLVHIGRIGFRFTLRSSAIPAKPVVTPQEPPE